MEAVLCIIFSVFAVYGLYSALREFVYFIDGIIDKNELSDDDGEGDTDTSTDYSEYEYYFENTEEDENMDNGDTK